MTSPTNQIANQTPNQAGVQEQLLAFGQAFRAAYVEAGLSKHAVALAVPLDRSAIGKIEKANRKPQFETVLRLARAARTTPSALLGGPVDGRVPAGAPAQAGDRAPAGAETNGKASLQASATAAAKRLGENLKLIREAVEPKLTQEELALTANVDRSSVNGYETGREAPSLETILKLAATLEVGAWRLLEGVALAPGAAPKRKAGAGTPAAAAKAKRPGRGRRRG